MEYTVTVDKKDARTKSGVRPYQKVDVHSTSEAAVLAYYNEVFPAALGFTVAVRETYVTRKNVMTGAEFKERYDTPYFCSPSSESFWTA